MINLMLSSHGMVWLAGWATATASCQASMAIMLPGHVPGMFPWLSGTHHLLMQPCVCMTGCDLMSTALAVIMLVRSTLGQ